MKLKDEIKKCLSLYQLNKEYVLSNKMTAKDIINFFDLTKDLNSNFKTIDNYPDSLFKQKLLSWDVKSDYLNIRKIDYESQKCNCNEFCEKGKNCSIKDECLVKKESYFSCKIFVPKNFRTNKSFLLSSIEKSNIVQIKKCNICDHYFYKTCPVIYKDIFTFVWLLKISGVHISKEY